MILLHAGYGIGSLLVPLYANPFLAVEADKPNNTLPNTTSPSHDEIVYSKESRIEYTYLISAIPVVLMSLGFFGYQIREIRYMRAKANDETVAVDKTAVDSKETDRTDEPTEDIPKPRSFREMVDPGTCAGGRRLYATELWLLLIFYFANTGGGERMISGFIRSYSVDQLNFSNSNGSLINTSFWVSFLFGRLSFFLLARWVSIRKLILIETGTVLCVTILMNFLAYDSSLAFWILIQPLGFFLAPMWPSGVSWADYHMELTGMGMMLVLLGGSVGGTCHLKLIGYLYEHKGTRTFLYQLAGYGALAFTLAIVLDLVGLQHGNRFKWPKPDKEAKLDDVEMSEKSKEIDSLDNL